MDTIPNTKLSLVWETPQHWHLSQQCLIESLKIGTNVTNQVMLERRLDPLFSIISKGTQLLDQTVLYIYLVVILFLLPTILVEKFSYDIYPPYLLFIFNHYFKKSKVTMNIIKTPKKAPL